MKLSIIIPNFNYDKFLSSTLDSILNQDYQDIEIIVVDDGSTDNSLNILKDYEIQHPNNIRVISQKNCGQAFAINVGIENSTGDLLGWINSDDFYEPNVFKSIVSSFKDLEEVDIVFGNINMVDYHGEYVHCLKHFKFSYFISTFTGFSNNISSNAIFWRKKSFNNNMYLNVNFKCGLDREFFSRLTHNKVIKHVNITIANYRIQPISKAAINYRDWDGLINHESNLVFHKSYPNLWISKFIGVDFAKKMIFIFLLYRRFQKIFTGRYLIYYLEKRKYSRNKFSN